MGAEGREAPEGASGAGGQTARRGARVRVRVRACALVRVRGPLEPRTAACPLPVLSGCGFLAVLLTAVFLEPVRDAQPEGEGEKQAPPFWSTLLSTFKLLRDKRLRLLILLPMLSGFEQAFLSGDYTRVREELAGGRLGAPRAACSPSGLGGAAHGAGCELTWPGTRVASRLRRVSR